MRTTLQRVLTYALTVAIVLAWTVCLSLLFLTCGCGANKPPDLTGTQTSNAAGRITARAQVIVQTTAEKLTKDQAEKIVDDVQELNHAADGERAEFAAALEVERDKTARAVKDGRDAVQKLREGELHDLQRRLDKLEGDRYVKCALWVEAAIFWIAFVIGLYIVLDIVAICAMPFLAQGSLALRIAQWINAPVRKLVHRLIAPDGPRA